VEDMAKGLVACALKGNIGEAYNLASGVETSILELANTINELTSNINNIILNPARDWDRSGKRFGSTLKSSEQLNFVASTSIAVGLLKTIEWTKINSELISQNIIKHDFMMNQLIK
jgi:nucleoside-diphosphate-sugar epimerase